MAGCAVAGLALQPAWPIQATITVVLGFGYSMLQNTLQTRVSDLAPGARASAVSGQAFSFSMAQAAGPVVFGFLLPALEAARPSSCSAHSSA